MLTAHFVMKCQRERMNWYHSSPRGVRLKCYAFFLVCSSCSTSYIVSLHIQCQASIYTLSLCREHSWRVRLAKQETLTPSGHRVSPLVCRGPWMIIVVLYYRWNSDGVSVRMNFTFVSLLFPLLCGAGSTVPRERFDSSDSMPFSWCVVAVTLPIQWLSTSSVKPLYIHFRCVAGIHGGCG